MFRYAQHDNTVRELVILSEAKNLILMVKQKKPNSL